MRESFAEINGHRVADLSRATPQGHSSVDPLCVRCGAPFTDRLDIECTPCPAIGSAHGHELVSDLDDGLLYCRRCPLVAYDLDDVVTEPTCPIQLQP